MDIDIRSRLCYSLAMKRIILTLICLISLLPTAEAKIDASQLLGDLLQVISEPQQNTPAQATPQKQTEPSFGEQMSLMVRAATAPMLENFKEEGRKYAKELGDIVTRQIKEEKKINQTLDSLRIFCWAVVAYLTIVTALVIYLLLRLRVLHTKLMHAVNKLTIGK